MKIGRKARRKDNSERNNGVIESVGENYEI